MNCLGRGRGGKPVRVDAALQETLVLLALVQREEEVHARLDRCVTELRAIRQARDTLMDRTQAELDEAMVYLLSKYPTQAVAPSAEEVGR